MKLVNFLCRLVMAADSTESKIVRLIEEDPQGWTFLGDSVMLHSKSGLRVYAYIHQRYTEISVEKESVIYRPSRGEKHLVFKAARKAIEANDVIKRRIAKKRMETALSDALAKVGL